MKLVTVIGIGIACALLTIAAMVALGTFEHKERIENPITSTRHEKWQFIDADRFTLSLPLNWQFNKLGGIDSYVGEFVGDGATLYFDFGRYSNSLVEDNDSKYSVLFGTIGGYKAKIVIPKERGDGITGVYFGELENQNKFSLYGRNLNPVQERTALGIFVSIEFKRLWKDGGNDE